MKSETAQTLLDKVRGDYDEIASEFSSKRQDLWPELQAFLPFVHAGDRVLDIGCGNGRAYQLFRGLAISYEGLDQSVGLIELARQRVQDVLAEFRVGSMLALPYENESFDVAMMIASVHHIPSARLRQKAFNEAWRVLKPGGWLLMTNWNRWDAKYAREHVAMIGRRLRGEDFDFGDVLIPWRRDGSDKRLKAVDRYYHAFTPYELAQIAKAAKFTVHEQYSVKKGARVTPWWKGDNLMTILRKEKS